MPTTPKPDPVRGHRGRGIVKLPAEGRAAPPPPWPMATEPTDAEAAVWADLWRLPQAIAWERMGIARVVARYCRLLVACESPGATAARHAQATALEDRLGLSPKAMRLLLWEIATDDVAEKRATPLSARGRIKAVEAR